MDNKLKIKNNLLNSLKKQSAFWSYQKENINNISDEMLIEKTLVELDIDEINKLFSIFPKKKIKEVWRYQLCIQEPYYHELNNMLACLYFDIKNPNRYLKLIKNKHLKSIKQDADEWAISTYGKNI